MKRLVRALDRHWFAPTATRDLALARIIMVCGQLALLLREAMPGCADCGPAYHRSLATADPELFQALPALKVLLLPLGGWGIRPEPMFLHAVWWGAIVSGFGALLGAYTRLSLLCFAAANTLLTAHVYSYGRVHHPSALLVIMLWVLAFSPAGQAWSWDNLRERLRFFSRGNRFEPVAAETSPFARWPLRVGQWLLVLGYFSAAYSKLSKGGLEWFNGYTLMYYWLQDGIFNDIPLAIELAGHRGIAIVLSVVTVAFELSFALAVLVPALAIPYILVGSSLHIGIFITMKAPFFQWIFVYAAFSEQIRRFLGRFGRKWTAGAWSVYYDALCPLCIRTMVLLDYADVFHRLRFVDIERSVPPGFRSIAEEQPDGTPGAMLAVGPDGAVHRGFFAFRALAARLPPFWPLLPVLHLPLASAIGPRVYGWIAGRRRRRLCRVDACVAAGHI